MQNFRLFRSTFVGSDKAGGNDLQGVTVHLLIMFVYTVNLNYLDEAVTRF